MRLPKLVAAGLASLALAGCVQGTPPVSDKVAEYQSRAGTPAATAGPLTGEASNVVFHDFNTASAIPPGLGVVDTGKNTFGMKVDGGKLVHGDPTGPQAAGYVEQGIGKPVSRIGADVVFNGANSGQLALVAWESSLQEARSAGDPVPNGGIHFVAGPTQWHYGIFVSGEGERILRQGTLALPTDGVTPNRFEILRDGPTVTIALPNGSKVGPFTDPEIDSMTGEWATWELYEHTEEYTPAAIVSAWAG